MRITVFGATGNVGREVVAEAVRRGHDVTAVSRAPGGAPAQPPGVRTLAGDAGRVDDVAAATRGQDVAISATSPKAKASADAQVTAALGGIFALSEAYPDLKANQNMLSLQEELTSTENKVGFARQYYNDVVTAYNTRLETFPSSIFANMGGFKAKELFELDEPAARDAVKVQF